MFNFFRHILMDEATDGTSASGYGDTEQTTTTDTTTTETTGDSKSTSEQPASTTQEDQKPAGDSGYETTEGETVTEGQEPSTTTEETPPAEEDYTVEVEGVKPEEVKDIVDLAKNNKLNKEQATELVKFYKAQQDKIATEDAAYDAKVKETYANWAKELKEDKEFGGANFLTNVNNVNTVLGTHFPSFAKSLKDRGARLSPDMMREMNKVYHLLHGEKPLVTGDTATASKERNPWDFYGSQGT